MWTEQGKDFEELSRATCQGAVDVAVNSAWSAVREYINAIAKGTGQALGFRPERRGPIVVTMDRVTVDIEGYLQFEGNGMCLELKQRFERVHVIISSSPDCYFNPDLDFTVERTDLSLWGVVAVQKK